MSSPDLIKSYTAEAAITKFRIVKFGSTDGSVLQAAASIDLLIGVADAFNADAADRVDVIRSGIAPVEYGAAVTRGQRLTADAQGRAVAVGAVAGTNYQFLGVAELSGTTGDIGLVQINPGTVQG